MPKIFRIFSGKMPAGGLKTPPETRTGYTVRKANTITTDHKILANLPNLEIHG
jgi:hypothetical protein